MAKKTTKQTETKEVVKMAGTVIDFSGVADFSPIPTGEYVSNITGGKVRPTRAGDSENLNVEFTIDDDEAPELNGRKAFRSFSLKPDALPYLKQFFVRAGVDPDDMTSGMTVEEILATVFGNKVVLNIQLEEDDRGEMRSNVRSVRAY